MSVKCGHTLPLLIFVMRSTSCSRFSSWCALSCRLASSLVSRPASSSLSRNWKKVRSDLFSANRLLSILQN